MSGREALSREGFARKHSLGQHFLTDPDLLKTLVALSGVEARDKVVEIGPGFGDLTRVLARSADAVLAVEVDERLRPFLELALREHPNARVVFGDVLRLNLPELFEPLSPLKVVANIPYYLFTPLLRRLLCLPCEVDSISLLVQAEAAERVVAGPGSKAYGPLSVLAQYKTEPFIALRVEAARFTPPPRVDSAFLCMPRRRVPAAAPRSEALFLRTVEAAFAQRRKTLLNSLSASFALPREALKAALSEAGLSPNLRGEALDIPAFAALSDALGRALAARP